MVVYGPYPPSGGRTRWRLQIYDPATRRKKSLTAATREEAEALVPVLEAELRRQVPVRLHAAIGQYLDHKRTLAQAAWVKTLGDRLLGFLPDVPVGEVSPRQAEALYAAAAQRVGRFGVVKAATHQALLRNTKELFRWLVKKGLATANPFADVEPVGRASAGKPQPRETDALKLDALLFAQARQGDEGALALLVQMYLGLRSGEVLGLRVGAVERQGQKVSVVRGKTRSARRALELYPEVAALLWAHCQGRPEDERVFAANLPRQPRPDWMYKRLRKRCAEAGLPPFCPHSLRGLHSSLALAGGATSHAVAASLGHASFATTAKHYADPAAIDNAKVRRVVGVLRRDAGDALAAEVARLTPEERARLLALLKAS